MARASPERGEESTSGYFRAILTESPELLDTGNNDELRRRWLVDHPGHKEIPRNIVQNLNNLKSVLRREHRKQGRRTGETARAGRPRLGGGGLAKLEENIDECLIFAKDMDREGLAPVIHLLRDARNEVVRMHGQM